MTEVAYSLEAMRSLLMLDSGERGRAIETIEKLASAYDALCAERDIVAAAGASSNGQTDAVDTPAQAVTDGDENASNADPCDDADQKSAAETLATSPDGLENQAPRQALTIPGTLPLGTSGNFCLAPFSPTGDFVVALDDNITVVSLIDVIDGLNKASSE